MLAALPLTDGRLIDVESAGQLALRKAQSPARERKTSGKFGGLSGRTEWEFSDETGGPGARPLPNPLQLVRPVE